MPDVLFIEIDILWNSTSLNTSIEAVIEPESASSAISPASLTYKPFNTVGTGVRSTSTTTLRYFNASGMLWTGYNGLTGSAISAVPSRNITPTMLVNSSLWTPPTITSQPSSTLFTSHGSLKNVSQRMIFLIFSYYYFRDGL